MAAQSGCASAQKVLDRYQVGRPALSHDGRLLAFDFYETASDASRSTHRMIGVYDIEAETVQLHIAPPPRSFSTPSFSPDGQFLTMIQRCWDPSCSADELGLNIGLLHLESGRFRLVTSGKTKMPVEDRPNRLFTLRGYPVFSQTEPVIYYTYGSGPFGRPPNNYLPHAITQYTQGSEKLGSINLNDGKEKWGIDFGNKEGSHAYYGSICCVSTTGNSIFFKAAAVPTLDADKDYHKKGVELFRFDIGRNVSEPVFPNPPYFDGMQVHNGGLSQQPSRSCPIPISDRSM